MNPGGIGFAFHGASADGLCDLKLQRISVWYVSDLPRRSLGEDGSAANLYIRRKVIYEQLNI